MISTGNGLKDIVNAQRAAPPPIEVLPSVKELENNLKEKAPDLLKGGNEPCLVQEYGQNARNAGRASVSFLS